MFPSPDRPAVRISALSAPGRLHVLAADRQVHHPHAGWRPRPEQRWDDYRAGVRAGTLACRVLVRRSAAADVIGEIIEDHAAVSRTRWWARVGVGASVGGRGRCWALVFADTEGLTIDPSLHQPTADWTAMCPLLSVGRISLVAG